MQKSEQYYLDCLCRQTYYKFEHQFTVKTLSTTYRLDFYCKELNLALEIDGKYHNLKKQKDYDRHRQEEIVKTLNCKFARYPENSTIPFYIFVNTLIARIENGKF